jgi:hypothetical protein
MGGNSLKRHKDGSFPLSHLVMGAISFFSATLQVCECSNSNKLLWKLRRLQGPRSGGNILNVSHRHRTAFPRRQDLTDALMNEAVPRGDFLATPAQDEIKLNQPSLEIRAVVFFKCGHLTWETNTVPTDRFAELIEPQAT